MLCKWHDSLVKLAYKHEERERDISSDLLVILLAEMHCLHFARIRVLCGDKKQRSRWDQRWGKTGKKGCDNGLQTSSLLIRWASCQTSEKRERTESTSSEAAGISPLLTASSSPDTRFSLAQTAWLKQLMCLWDHFSFSFRRKKVLHERENSNSTLCVPSHLLRICVYFLSTTTKKYHILRSCSWELYIHDVVCSLQTVLFLPLRSLFNSTHSAPCNAFKRMLMREPERLEKEGMEQLSYSSLSHKFFLCVIREKEKSTRRQNHIHCRKRLLPSQLHSLLVAKDFLASNCNVWNLSFSWIHRECCESGKIFAGH